MKPNFDIEFLPETIEFLETLDEKTREKIYYNAKKAQFVKDEELFKKLNEFIWNSGLCTTAKRIDFIHFGTKQMAMKV